METDNINTTTEETPAAPKVRKPRGFAALSKEQRIEASRKGGKAAHVINPETGRAPGYEWNSDEASAAGKRGGLISGARASARKAARKKTRAAA
jgi:general stress protein YciG